MAGFGAVGGELATHPLGGRLLIAKHIGVRRPAPGAEQVDEPEREKCPVAEPGVGRRRRGSAREAPEEHRVRQTVPFRTSLRHHWPPSLRPDGVPPLPPPHSAARAHPPVPGTKLSHPPPARNTPRRAARVRGVTTTPSPDPLPARAPAGRSRASRW